MKIAWDAWNKVDMTTIQNCWWKAGILSDLLALTHPNSQPALPISSLIHLIDTAIHITIDPISHTEMLVTGALDELEVTGTLQHSNWIDIAELLNLAIKTNNVFDVADQDIYKCVMEAKRLREYLDRLGDGDDVNILEPVPTCCEALQFAFGLKQYLRALDDDLPFARKLEVMLGSFGQQTHTAMTWDMTETKLTDFLLINSFTLIWNGYCRIPHNELVCLTPEIPLSLITHTPS